jgi:hypothetical protein
MLLTHNVALGQRYVEAGGWEPGVCDQRRPRGTVHTDPDERGWQLFCGGLVGGCLTSGACCVDPLCAGCGLFFEVIGGKKFTFSLAFPKPTPKF